MVRRKNTPMAREMISFLRSKERTVADEAASFIAEYMRTRRTEPRTTSRMAASLDLYCAFLDLQNEVARLSPDPDAMRQKATKVGAMALAFLLEAC